MSPPDDEAIDGTPSGLSRRAFARWAVATGGASALAACLDVRTVGGDGSLDARGGVTDPGALPERQHAWNDALETDADGNVRPAEHHVFLGLSLTGPPDDAARETVETALREVERALERSPSGLLFTLAYTPAYFDRFETPLPDAVDLPDPDPITAVAAESRVAVHTNDALLHLASDDAAALLAAEQALFGERTDLNGRSLADTLDSAFDVAFRRTGFVGPGLPADRQDGLEGIPDGEPVPDEAPFFMGFRSGFRESQATEDRVTIRDGPFAGGSTQHFESIELDLDVWFGADHEHRVARMFSPEHADEEAVGDVGERLSTETGVSEVTDDVHEHARERSVVGHAQKVARARDEDGDPVLLRRDVNTTDEDVAGLHFVSLQRGIGEFRRVREAMLGGEFRQYGLGPRQPNGILQYLRVRSWGDYLVPPRSCRALPRPDPTR